MPRYRTCWISDVHLGTRGCQAEKLGEFLRDMECGTLYLVGDFIDMWALKREIYWKQSHSDVLQKILSMGRNGTEIIYIPGNHDEFIGNFLGTYASVSIQKNAIHTTANNRRLLIIHGHELDTVAQNLGWLAQAGDIGYTFLLRANRLVNFTRRLLGLNHWSLSAYVKNEVKNIAVFIRQFEEAVIHCARDYDVQGVLCGHIHTASSHVINGVEYYNTGDWVENCTAVVEHANGSMELIHPCHTPIPAEPRARPLTLG